MATVNTPPMTNTTTQDCRLLRPPGSRRPARRARIEITPAHRFGSQRPAPRQ
ncbi:MAG: hypothetical protein ACRDPY_43595 [Streptosporangiaceae bacterium]